MKSCCTTHLNSVGLLILRLGFGGYMITHGWPKFQMLMRREFDQFPDPLGIGNTMSLIGAAGAEFVCAVLVLVGLATRFAAIPIVFTMGVAAFIVHSDDPWTMGSGASKEPALLFLTAFLAIALTGPGRISLDHLIFSKRLAAVKPAPKSE
ncbi:MAG: DoxX family protein [Phycisphaeraceae bacterium]|nr:MAG: DoxX family protein [Phycisphaeraceae bacterium]